MRSFSRGRRRGHGTITWDGRDEAGKVVRDGTYQIALTPRDKAGNRGPTRVVQALVLTTVKSTSQSLRAIYTSDRDRYARSTRIAFTLTHRARVSWVIRDSDGRIVRRHLDGRIALQGEDRLEVGRSRPAGPLRRPRVHTRRTSVSERPQALSGSGVPSTWGRSASLPRTRAPDAASGSPSGSTARSRSSPHPGSRSDRRAGTLASCPPSVMVTCTQATIRLASGGQRRRPAHQGTWHGQAWRPPVGDPDTPPPLGTAGSGAWLQPWAPADARYSCSRAGRCRSPDPSRSRSPTSATRRCSSISTDCGC